MISRLLAFVMLAAGIAFALDCRPKPELHGKPCTREGGQCARLGVRPGEMGEACVIVYSSPDFDCTGEGYCAPRCDDAWEACMATPAGELREKCLEYARLHTKCAAGFVCKRAPTFCDPSKRPWVYEPPSDSVCVSETVYPMKAPERRSSCNASPP